MAITATLPAGRYYLGDLCYALEPSAYQRLVGDLYDGLHAWEGRQLVWHGTAYGDGGYVGSDGFVYGVDSGTIGLAPAEMCRRSGAAALGRMIDFEAPVTFAVSGGGTFEVSDGSTTVTIETGG